MRDERGDLVRASWMDRIGDVVLQWFGVAAACFFLQRWIQTGNLVLFVAMLSMAVLTILLAAAVRICPPVSRQDGSSNRVGSS